ncbi:hypothetical protein K435DRAFT_863895 [Dendrothele bispora CBS 962.96]|uniref:Uncharacterized protein n=1 Tax=Dendrothele bispora (strain CBS 962.96) TaxID=1314807 RepID=A0A4S8LNJ6_DENBC|nr:hypothetical protein K435DRAFT_863895 [Dendrothele bispora CBS 962.96]
MPSRLILVASATGKQGTSVISALQLCSTSVVDATATDRRSKIRLPNNQDPSYLSFYLIGSDVLALIGLTTYALASYVVPIVKYKGTSPASSPFVFTHDLPAVLYSPTDRSFSPPLPSSTSPRPSTASTPYSPIATTSERERSSARLHSISGHFLASPVLARMQKIIGEIYVKIHIVGGGRGTRGLSPLLLNQQPSSPSPLLSLPNPLQRKPSHLSSTSPPKAVTTSSKFPKSGHKR